jgi:hypothetical protein
MEKNAELDRHFPGWLAFLKAISSSLKEKFGGD